MVQENAYPAVSVIVFARENVATLPDTLRSLQIQKRFDAIEVILADGCGDTVLDPIAERFPWVQRLRLAPGNMPFLKGEAIAVARGDIVAIIDPNDAAEPGWIDEILAGFADPSIHAVGGAVLLPDDRDANRAANRAAYLFEYGCFNPPIPAGITAGDLPGNNVAYRRDIIVNGCADILRDVGFNKPFCHNRIRERGGSLIIRPSMQIRHLTRHQFFDFGLRRFHYGRCFGANRRRLGTGHMRLLHRMLAPAVPMLLILRHLLREHSINRSAITEFASAADR